VMGIRCAACSAAQMDMSLYVCNAELKTGGAGPRLLERQGIIPSTLDDRFDDANYRIMGRVQPYRTAGRVSRL